MFNAQEQVKRVFISSDAQDWETLASIFHKSVELDYHSMNGTEAAVLPQEDIINSWKGLLPGFEHTHHQVGNIISTENGDTASVFAYGTATHYLQDEKGSVWTVVGTYDFDLQKVENTWRVTKMKFNYKYQDGNSNLIQKAMERVKQ